MIEDRQSAIEFAVKQAEAEDIVVFVGKGGEAYQVIGDEYVPYDEVATVQAAISQQLKSTTTSSENQAH